RRRRPQARGQGALPPGRRADHRGLWPDRDLAHPHPQPPRRLPLRQRRPAVRVGGGEAGRGRRDPGPRPQRLLRLPQGPGGHLATADPSGAPERARSAALASLVQERIDAVNAQLASYESLKRFAILDEPLTLAGGHLTPTLKVKREKVYETFRDVFEALYAT